MKGFVVEDLGIGYYQDVRWISGGIDLGRKQVRLARHRLDEMSSERSKHLSEDVIRPSTA